MKRPLKLYLISVAAKCFPSTTNPYLIIRHDFACGILAAFGVTEKRIDVLGMARQWHNLPRLSCETLLLLLLCRSPQPVARRHAMTIAI